MTVLELYAEHTAWATTAGAILGLLVGSFLNVVIGRYPIIMQRQWRRECELVMNPEQPQQAPQQERFNLAVPGSHCPKCHHGIAWYDNIPIFSWLFLLNRKCRHCQKPISGRYPAIELLTGLVFALLAWNFGVGFELLVYLVLASLLICLFFIDADEQILPDPFNYVVLWLGLAAALWGYTIPLADAVTGAIGGYLFLWSVYWLFKLLTGKEGMGYGDFKLLAAIGAWVGYQQLPVVIIASAGSGAVLGLLWQWLRQEKQGQPIPFGPFLICGAVISMLWGEVILYNYWSWLVN